MAKPETLATQLQFTDEHREAWLAGSWTCHALQQSSAKRNGFEFGFQLHVHADNADAECKRLIDDRYQLAVLEFHLARWSEYIMQQQTNTAAQDPLYEHKRDVAYIAPMQRTISQHVCRVFDLVTTQATQTVTDLELWYALGVVQYRLDTPIQRWFAHEHDEKTISRNSAPYTGWNCYFDTWFQQPGVSWQTVLQRLWRCCDYAAASDGWYGFEAKQVPQLEHKGMWNTMCQLQLAIVCIGLRQRDCTLPVLGPICSPHTYSLLHCRVLFSCMWFLVAQPHTDETEETRRREYYDAARQCLQQHVSEKDMKLWFRDVYDYLIATCVSNGTQCMAAVDIRPSVFAHAVMMDEEDAANERKKNDNEREQEQRLMPQLIKLSESWIWMPWCVQTQRLRRVHHPSQNTLSWSQHVREHLSWPCPGVRHNDFYDLDETKPLRVYEEQFYRQTRLLHPHWIRHMLQLPPPDDVQDPRTHIVSAMVDQCAICMDYEWCDAVARSCFTTRREYQRKVMEQLFYVTTQTNPFALSFLVRLLIHIPFLPAWNSEHDKECLALGHSSNWLDTDTVCVLRATEHMQIHVAEEWLQSVPSLLQLCIETWHNPKTIPLTAPRQMIASRLQQLSRLFATHALIEQQLHVQLHCPNELVRIVLSYGVMTELET